MFQDPCVEKLIDVNALTFLLGVLCWKIWLDKQVLIQQYKP